MTIFNIMIYFERTPKKMKLSSLEVDPIKALNKPVISTRPGFVNKSINTAHEFFTNSDVRNIVKVAVTVALGAAILSILSIVALGFFGYFS